MKIPDIAISYEEGMPDIAFQEMHEAISQEGLSILLEKREKSGPWAGVEWFLPTAAIIFISKAYFDAFLKEAGKDHYHKLKAWIASTTNKTMSHPRIEPIVIPTKGKTKSDNPYSMALSFYAETNDGNRFKLLLPKPSENADYSQVTFKFLEFLNDYYSGVKLIDDIGYDEKLARPPGMLILLHFNPETSAIEWLDHRESR